MAAENASGVIHDIGYQRYAGPRLGRSRIAAALCWHSLRSAFGIGRGAKAKILPVFALAVMCAPAVINAAVMALSGRPTPVVPYDTYVNTLRVVMLLIFVAMQAPELVSRDLRSHVLPLYFARPIRRADYPAAKYAALVLACLVMIEVPLLLLYVGTILQVHGGAAIWAQTRALLPGLAVGVMWAVVLAAIGLVLASLSGRRAFATGAVAIFLFLSFTLAQALIHVARANSAATAHAPPGPGGIVAVLPPSAAEHLFGLLSPFTIIDGVRQWLGGTSPGLVAPPGTYGWYYGAALLLLLGASLGGLFARYARMDIG